MSNKLLIGFAIALFAIVCVGCNKSDNANANANVTETLAISNSTRPGPDNSEITTAVDANGVKTETRVFHNNPRVSKVVVVTTREGKRTVTVHAPSGEARELNKKEPEDVLEATGSAIADAVGFVVQKTVDLADKTKEGAKTVGEKTAEGAKTVGEKTAEGAKKTGKAIKKAVSP